MAGLLFVAAGGWGMLAPTTANAAAPAPCRPSFETLIAAMASGIPTTSPIWDQAQSAMSQAGGGPAGIDAMISVLKQNHYTWDCASCQLIAPDGTALGGPSAPAAGSSGATSGGSASGATGSAATAGSGTGSASGGTLGVQGARNGAGVGASGAGGVRAGSGQTDASGSSLASSQSSDSGGGAGTGTTLPMVAALVLSTALVVLVSFRHYRRI